MGIPEAPSQNIDELKSQNDMNGQFLMDPNKNISGQKSEDGVSAVKVTKNFVPHVQKIVSDDFSVHRRVSPRLKNIDESRRPYYGSENEEASDVEVAENFVSHVQKIVSEESSVQRRASPRLKNIVESERPCYGTDNSAPAVTEAENFVSHVQKIVYEESSMQRRASPRLKNIAESERPYYGTDNSASAVTQAENFVSLVQKIVSEETSVQRRASPRLKNIAESQRPYYGTENGVASAVEVTENFVSQVQKIACEEKSVQRRVSPRLKNIDESKRPYYGTLQRNSLQHSKDQNSQENFNVNHFNAKTSQNVSGQQDVDKEHENEFDHSQLKDLANDTCGKVRNLGSRSDSAMANGVTCFAAGNNGNIDSKVENSKWLDGCSSSPNDGKSVYAKVKQTMKIYNRHYLHFVQEKEKRVEKGLKRKKPDASDEEVVKRSAERPDLKAIAKMLETKTIMYPKKRFGHLPGIDVGYKFYSRAEMVALGFHGHWLYGIDFMGKSYSKLREYKGYTFPLAVAIVLSGQYEDDVDNLEDVLYTGQGGNDLLGNKRQVKNQEMSRGNLALKNNMEQSVPVRVVRGHESDHKSCGRIFTYDGLYKVVQCWPERGASGFVVYKYRLKRLEGQPKLTTHKVHFTQAHGSKASSKLPGLVSEDISGGQEDIRIPATNLIDDTPVSSTGFTYSKSNQVAENINLPPNAEGCKCKGNCTNPNVCACAKLNGTDFPYVVLRNRGRLIEAKDVVFECGPNCHCGLGCINRISQQGIKYQLEVFRTPTKGWAVRSREYIPSGAPVCEYIGVLRRTDELDNVDENDYIFEIDCLHTMKGIGGRERRLGDSSVPVSNQLEEIDDKTLESTPEFCIDAGSVGNVARFINHSCEPNLFVQCVLSTHHDVRLARVVLFAAESIPPLQELTYDYGYALDSVVGPDGKIKELPCHCGTADCRKRLY